MHSLVSIIFVTTVLNSHGNPKRFEKPTPFENRVSFKRVEPEARYNTPVQNATGGVSACSCGFYCLEDSNDLMK